MRQTLATPFASWCISSAFLIVAAFSECGGEGAAWGVAPLEDRHQNTQCGRIAYKEKIETHNGSIAIPCKTLQDVGVRDKVFSAHWAQNKTCLKSLHCHLAGGEPVLIRNALNDKVLKELLQASKQLPASGFERRGDGLENQEFFHQAKLRAVERNICLSVGPHCQSESFLFSHSCTPLQRGDGSYLDESFDDFISHLEGPGVVEFLSSLAGIDTNWHPSLYLQGLTTNCVHYSASAFGNFDHCTVPPYITL